MKRALLLLSLLSGLLSACSTAIPPASEAAASLPEEALARLTPTWMATLPPTPPATFTAADTATAAPTAGPTLCNAAELVDHEYLAESGDSIARGSHFTLVLRLANTGTCTWTREFAFVLIANQGIPIANPQNFSATAVPGQTVDLYLELTAPDSPGCFSAAWVMQDAEGDLFGYGPDALNPFALAVWVVGKTAQADFTYCLTPEEACTDLPKEAGLPRFARLMHDPQWMPWPSRIADPDWPKGFHFDWYPETVQLWTRPKGGDGRVRYNREWLEYLRALQPNDEAAVWIARISAGLFNRGNEFIPILNLDRLEEEPVAESISSGGNVVRVLEFKNNSARIEMLFLDDPPPDPRQVNYQTRPWLVTKFTSVSVEGELGNAGGIDVYFPNLARQEEGYWVDTRRIEMFPPVPFCAEVEESLSVMAAPSHSAPRYGIFSPGQQVMVHGYTLRGSDVWGRISQGWIPLVYQEDGQPIYPTSWSMETRPPITFR